MVSDGDKVSDGDRLSNADRSDSALVERWLALDRGWQALAFGLGVVAVHAAGQVAGLF